jgi:antitoxin ParD1/3/4
MVIKSSISLTDEQYQFAKMLVESGRFSSVSAVMQQGIEILRRDYDNENLEREALARLLAQREDGPFLSKDQMKQSVASMLNAKRNAHGL